MSVCQNHPEDASDKNVKAVGTSGKRNKDEIAAGQALVNISKYIKASKKPSIAQTKKERKDDTSSRRYHSVDASDTNDAAVVTSGKLNNKTKVSFYFIFSLKMIFFC